MSRHLLDSGPVIRHLRGHRETVQLLRGLGKMERLGISTVTRIEVHAGLKPEQRYGTRKLLARFITYEVDRDIADRAGDLIAESRARGIVRSIPDAIIASTAITHRLTLVTYNIAHFADIPGLSVLSLIDG